MESASKSLSIETLTAAKNWAKHDPNSKTAYLLRQLMLDDATVSKVEAMFSGRIGFGTAGLRAEMKTGPQGMNDLVVVQTAQGLASYVAQSKTDDEVSEDYSPKVVIGYDHRENPILELSSLGFALYSSLVFDSAGFEVILLEGFVHTPLVPFTVKKLGCELGIMITASHNPAQDAGYKVYAGDGCQIRPPMDKDIAETIQSELTPWRPYGFLMRERKTKYPNDPCLGFSNSELTEQLKNDYFEAIRDSGIVALSADPRTQTLSTDSADATPRDPPKFCYTAMHGVGYPAAKRMFSMLPTDDGNAMTFHSVDAQQDPDPTFRTVGFPNPEEKGALDIAQSEAEMNGCDIIFANDPDADRLAVAEQDRETKKWTVFTGDQIGTMLGHWLWETVGKKDKNDDGNRPVAMLASTVSSTMLATIAKIEGFHFEDTLTGFKWIGSRGTELNDSGSFRTLFCYEEAIGFCCGNIIFDKDGISAMAVFAQLAMHVYRTGRTVGQHMQSLYNKYGEFVSNNSYYFYDDPSVVPKIMDDIRNGGNYAKSVGPYTVESIRDLGNPGCYDSTTPDKKPTLPTSKSSPMMTLRFDNGCVVQLRPSGTEPKFKYYIEMRGQPGEPREKVENDLREFSDVVLEQLLRPSQYGLRRC